MYSVSLVMYLGVMVLYIWFCVYGFVISLRFRDYFRTIEHVTAVRLREWTSCRRRGTRMNRYLCLHCHHA